MERGFGIKPYRLAQMVKMAAKMVETLTAVTPLALTKEEAHIVLEMVTDALNKRTEDGDPAA